MQSSDIMMDFTNIVNASIMLIGLVKFMVPKRLALEVSITPNKLYNKRADGFIEIHPLVLRTDMPTLVSVMIKEPSTVSARLVTMDGQVDAEYDFHATAIVPKTVKGALKVSSVALAEHVAGLEAVYKGFKGKRVAEKKWDELHEEVKKIEEFIAEYEPQAPSEKLTKLKCHLHAEHGIIDNIKTKTGRDFEMACYDARSQSMDVGRSFSLDCRSARTMSDSQQAMLRANLEEVEDGEIVKCSQPSQEDLAMDYALRQAD
jgi:hypothetical protein